MHQGANNIFSFSDDEFERAQRNQHQNRRSDKLRVLQSGFEAAAAAADHPHHLVPIDEEEEEEQEEEEGGILYGGASAGAAGGATNINSSASMLSEMFNYEGGPAGGDIVLAAAAAHDQSSSNHPPGAYQRLIQQTRPDFYGANNSRLQQGLLMSSSAAANITNNINNWMTGSVIHEDAAPSTTTLAAKQHHHHHHHHHGHGHGTNYVPAEASADSSPSTAMRLFFMNPAPTSTSTSVTAMRHQRSSASPDHPAHQPPMVPAASMLHHHHHHHDQSQAFLGGGAAGGATIFGGGGEGISSFGGGILRESLQQAGPALSLSSSTLQQLEMRKADQELREARSQGSAAAFLFYNSQQQQAAEQQLHLQHASTIQQPPPPPPPSSCFQPLQAGHQSQEGQYQQLHMSSSSSTTYGSMSTANVLRNSKYARAAQELLEEFCSVSRGHVRGNTLTGIRNSSMNPHLISHGASGVLASTSAAAAAAASSSSSKDIPPLSPADRFEYQRKKSKLLSMLDEVERRYNHYCEQMQMVVNSFDSVMGFGAAMPYTALARKAMSRHFRCLKDAVSAQLKQTCEVLGDNDGGSGSGLTKGETPKLRLIDQNLRQQRAFHQMGVMEQEAWRPQRGLPDRSVTILRSWLFEHFLHPYPSDADKHLLARKTGLSRNQVSNWFINARVRLWKPMVEDMYQQEAKEELEDSQQLNEDIHHETNTRRILLAAARTTQQQQQQQPDSTSPESDAPAETVSIPYRSQLDHYDRLRLAAAPITDHEPLPPPHDHDGDHTAAASNSLIIFPPPPLDDEMYRRAAAARTGDLSLTLGLRHAGGSNAPDTARFGL